MFRLRGPFARRAPSDSRAWSSVRVVTGVDVANQHQGRVVPRPGSIDVTRQEQAWVLTVEGEHDLTTVNLLDEQMTRVAAPAASVVIDLSAATFIDGRVVAWLVRWSERAGRPELLHLSMAVGHEGSFTTRLLDLLRRLELIGPMPVVETRAEALASLQAVPPRTLTVTGP